MDISILKLARRHRLGTRMWVVPGFTNAAYLSSEKNSFRDWGPSFKWPCLDQDGSEIQRSVDLNRHRSIARNAARDLINR